MELNTQQRFYIDRVLLPDEKVEYIDNIVAVRTLGIMPVVIGGVLTLGMLASTSYLIASNPTTLSYTIFSVLLIAISATWGYVISILMRLHFVVITSFRVGLLQTNPTRSAIHAHWIPFDQIRNVGLFSSTNTIVIELKNEDNSIVVAGLGQPQQFYNKLREKKGAQPTSNVVAQKKEHFLGSQLTDRNAEALNSFLSKNPEEQLLFFEERTIWQTVAPSAIVFGCLFAIALVVAITILVVYSYTSNPFVYGTSAGIVGVVVITLLAGLFMGFVPTGPDANAITSSFILTIRQTSRIISCIHTATHLDESRIGLKITALSARPLVHSVNFPVVVSYNLKSNAGSMRFPVAFDQPRTHDEINTRSISLVERLFWARYFTMLPNLSKNNEVVVVHGIELEGKGSSDKDSHVVLEM